MAAGAGAGRVGGVQPSGNSPQWRQRSHAKLRRGKPSIGFRGLKPPAERSRQPVSPNGDIILTTHCDPEVQDSLGSADRQAAQTVHEDPARPPRLGGPPSPTLTAHDPVATTTCHDDDRRCQPQLCRSAAFFTFRTGI